MARLGRRRAGQALALFATSRFGRIAPLSAAAAVVERFHKALANGDSTAEIAEFQRKAGDVH